MKLHGDEIGLLWQQPIKVKNIAQRPLGVINLPALDWQPPSGFPNLDCKRISIDVETHDADLKTLGPGVRRGAYIVGLSIGTDYGFRGYYPIRHAGGGNMDPELVMGWARSELPRFAGEVVGMNLLYDLDFLAQEEVHLNPKRFRDIMIAEPLLDEHRLRYDMDALAQTHLGESKAELVLKDACRAFGFGQTDAEIKGNIWQLPGPYAGAYGEGDADLPLRILPVQEALLEKEGLTELYDLECRLIPILLAMRRRGVRVDIKQAQRVREALVLRRDVAVKEFQRILGKPNANIAASASFAAALAERGLRMQKTKTGAYSITKPWLKANETDPAISALLKARSLDKTIGTFIDGHILGHHINGRIHTEFHQLKGERGGTIGRFSSSNPNLQNVPARDEELAPLIRGMFGPEEDSEWERDDYSQIEVRFEAHYAVGPKAEDFRQTYILHPDTDYHKLTAEWIGVDPGDSHKRKMVKGVNFSKKYGAQPPKLASLIGCSIEEAIDFVKRYEAALPWGKPTFEKCQNLAAARGYIKTILGRRARFPLWEPATNQRRKMEDRLPPMPEALARETYRGEYLVRANTYTAMNRLFQLGSADMMKKSMVDIWEAGICNTLGAPLLTVHDEIDWDVPRTKEADQASKEARHIMETCIKLKVPVLVDATRGRNWGECA